MAPFWCFSRRRRLIRWRLLPPLLLLLKRWNYRLWLCSSRCLAVSSRSQIPPLNWKKPASTHCSTSSSNSHTQQHFTFAFTYVRAYVCMRFKHFSSLCRGQYDLISTQITTHWHLNSTSIYHPLGNSFLHHVCTEHIASSLSTYTRLILIVYMWIHAFQFFVHGNLLDDAPIEPSFLFSSFPSSLISVGCWLEVFPFLQFLLLLLLLCAMH